MDALTLNPEHLQQLVRREMPYGKYKGRILADLPGDYLRWFAREGFPPGELGRLLALMKKGVSVEQVALPAPRTFVEAELLVLDDA